MDGERVTTDGRLRGRSRRGAWLLGLAALVALALPAGASAVGPFGPLNDLLALGQAGGQSPATVPVMRRAEPPLVATPRAVCGPGSKPEPGIQGRVPSGSATNGLHCNLTQVAHQGTSGGFKVLRYIDTAGRECAYYDTALLYPLNALALSGPSQGVAVIDMSNPAHPVQTDTLTELPMLSPHESLNLNTRRGLLAAVLGNPATYPGLVSIYDAHADCRHPVLQSTSLVARFGHESGFSPDGNTFYAAGTALQSITAIDVTDPKSPHAVWQGNESSHGLSISNDGNRAYIADPYNGQMAIFDTSQIQARKPNPQVREISRLTWNSASIPQNAIPFSEGGHPYVLEFDEYTAGIRGGSNDTVGAARIIDIADETAPRVIANLRLQVDQPADHAAAAGDPGAVSPVQGYAAHYCNVPTRVDPKLVACSFIASGLRLFDISDVTKPREVGYFVAPTAGRVENGFSPSDYAMSQPAFAPERHEVWYTDGTSGFYVLHVDSNVWDGTSSSATQQQTPQTQPKAKAKPKPKARACNRRRRFVVTTRLPRGAKVRSVTATLAGKRLRTSRKGRNLHVTVDLRTTKRTTLKLVVRVRLRSGRAITTRRAYRPCARKA
jgi:hypothetical protein